MASRHANVKKIKFIVLFQITLDLCFLFSSSSAKNSLVDYVVTGMLVVALHSRFKHKRQYFRSKPQLPINLFQSRAEEQALYVCVCLIFMLRVKIRHANCFPKNRTKIASETRVARNTKNRENAQNLK